MEADCLPPSASRGVQTDTGVHGEGGTCVCGHVLVRIGAPRAASREGWDDRSRPFFSQRGSERWRGPHTATRHVNVHITYQPVPLALTLVCRGGGRGRPPYLLGRGDRTGPARPGPARPGPARPGPPPVMSGRTLQPAGGKSVKCRCCRACGSCGDSGGCLRVCVAQSKIEKTEA